MKYKWQDLRPGCTLGDYHYVGPQRPLQQYIQEHIVEEIEVGGSVEIQGDRHEWLDDLVAEQLGKPEGSRFLTNKIITILQPGRWNGFTIGWSWDCFWIGLAHLRLKTKE